MHRALNCAEDADRRGKIRRDELAEKEGEGGIRLLIPNKKILIGDSVLPDGNHLGLKANETDPLVLRLPEDERLAVLDPQLHVVLHWLLGDVEERPIVEDVAVLEDLDERRTLVLRHSMDNALKMGRLDVDRSRHKGGAGAKRHVDGIERRVDRAV